MTSKLHGLLTESKLATSDKRQAIKALAAREVFANECCRETLTERQEAAR
jgi:hypothetical protein